MNLGHTAKNAPEKSNVLTLANCPVNGKVAALACCPTFIYRAILSLFSQVVYLQICFLEKLKTQASSFSQYYTEMFFHTDCDKAYRTIILTYSWEDLRTTVISRKQLFHEEHFRTNQRKLEHMNAFTITWSFFLWVLQWNGFLRHSIFYSLPQFPLFFSVLLESALLFKLLIFQFVFKFDLTSFQQLPKAWDLFFISSL